MSPAAIATANARLRGEENFLVAPTRDLGHYVVSRLALRLGVRVWLHESPLNGITARIVLPLSVLEIPEKVATAPIPAQPGGAVQQRNALPGPASNLATATATATASTQAPPAATTRNGLVKRERKAGPPRRPIRPAAPAPPADERPRTPSDVQSMLNTFRSGVHRAEQERDGGSEDR